MARETYGARHQRRLRRTALASGLALAIWGSCASHPVIAAAPLVPLSWPLAYERGAQLTPLRSAIDAMRITRPAPAGYRPRTLAVSDCSDDGGAGSLRSVVAQALSGDVVDLSELVCSRITLADGVLEIEVDDLTLRGPGSAALSIDGDGLDRVLLHPASGTLTIENLTIARGVHKVKGNDVGFGGCIATAGNLTLTATHVRDCIATGVGAYGGGVLSGPLTMTNSTISGNTAFGNHPVNGTAAYGGGAFSYGVDIADSSISGNSAIGTHNPPLSHWEIGGGLFVARNGGLIERSTISDNFAIRFAGGLTQEGDLVLRNSTISGNSTRDDDGGGVRVRQVTAITIENSTITDNRAGSFGGGLSFIDNALPSTIESSIIAGNRGRAGNDDTDSTRLLNISGSHNLIQARGSTLVLPADTSTADPRLLPLAANGGPTLTHALAANSAALDRGGNAQQLGTDQRGSGFVRVVNGAPDIGAYEVQGAGQGGAEAVAVPGPGSWMSVLLAALLGWLGIRDQRRRSPERALVPTMRRPGRPRNE